LTLHFRRHPDQVDAVAVWAAEAAQRSGLAVRPARQSVELHPPVEVDKGTALVAAAGDLDAVWFIGDDVGDLAAFVALERLGERGVAVVRCVVTSDELDPVLADHADVTLGGPVSVVDYLNELGVVANSG
jgi:trehalose 6-phosphate phosphatase